MVLDYLGETVVAVVRPFHPKALHHTVIKGRLGLPALSELHVGAAPLQAGGVRHELRGAHRLHLPEELQGAAGDVLAFLDTFPRRNIEPSLVLMVTNLGS